MATADFCDAVFDQSCEAAPPGDDDGPKVRTRCFSCGLAVCRSCSVITTWAKTYRSKRICTSCLADTEQGDVLALLAWQHAGYDGEPAAYVQAMYAA